MPTSPAEPLDRPAVIPFPHRSAAGLPSRDGLESVIRNATGLRQTFDEIRTASTSPVRTELENCLDRLDLLFPAVLDCAEAGMEQLRLQWFDRRTWVARALVDGSEV